VDVHYPKQFLKFLKLSNLQWCVRWICVFVIFINLVKEGIHLTGWPPLWYSGQSSWIQIQRSRFDSRSCSIFWEVVVLERGPLHLVIKIEELLGRNSSGPGLGNLEYGGEDPLFWTRHTLYVRKLVLTSPTSGGRSVGIVHSRAKAMEVFYPINRPWRPIGLWDVKDSTLSRQSAHR
jgi:hypothetical protein